MKLSLTGETLAFRSSVPESRRCDVNGRLTLVPVIMTTPLWFNFTDWSEASQNFFAIRIFPAKHTHN